jgi:hypothetical protein
VAALYSAQAYVSYTFAPDFWLAVNAGYFVVGHTRVDDLENDDEQEGTSFGATLALPVNKHHCVKPHGFTSSKAGRDHFFKAIGIAWQYRFGGGAEAKAMNAAPIRGNRRATFANPR